MDKQRYHKSAPSQPAKRRHESKPQHGPPSKKPRYDTGSFQKVHTTGAEITLPDPPPELPVISDHYAKLVFTHPGSTQKGSSTSDMANYDRLEFLGDAYIEIIASRLIFENYPNTNAGGMCHLREAVVKNETLSKYSLMYGFDKKLSVREFDYEKAGKNGWTKIYGDVFEAYCAAVVLSDPKAGEARLETWLKALWHPVLNVVKTEVHSGNPNAKEELAKKILIPGVRLNYVQERKPVLHVGQGKETFFVGLYMDGWGWKNQHLGSGEGASKVLAGNQAALRALENNHLMDEIMAKKEIYLVERAAMTETKTNKDVD